MLVIGYDLAVLAGGPCELDTRVKEEALRLAECSASRPCLGKLQANPRQAAEQSLNDLKSLPSTSEAQVAAGMRRLFLCEGTVRTC